jgi:hypothetical protein
MWSTDSILSWVHDMKIRSAGRLLATTVHWSDSNNSTRACQLEVRQLRFEKKDSTLIVSVSWHSCVSSSMRRGGTHDGRTDRTVPAVSSRHATLLSNRLWTQNTLAIRYSLRINNRSMMPSVAVVIIQCAGISYAENGVQIRSNRSSSNGYFLDTD